MLAYQLTKNEKKFNLKRGSEEMKAAKNASRMNKRNAFLKACVDEYHLEVETQDCHVGGDCVCACVCVCVCGCVHACVCVSVHMFIYLSYILPPLQESPDHQTYFVKVHIPWEQLLEGAEKIGLRMPINVR